MERDEPLPLPGHGRDPQQVADGRGVGPRVSDDHDPAIRLCELPQGGLVVDALVADSFDEVLEAAGDPPVGE